MNRLWKRLAYPKLLIVLKPEIRNKTTHLNLCQKSIEPSYALHNSCSNTIFPTVKRNKSKKAQVDSDDENENKFNDDSSLSKDSKVVKLNTTSLRTDLILKSALGLARNKIEQQFYESRIRVNGKKILKKSASVRAGDEVDIVKMVSPKNPDHLYVYRVEILNIAAKDESIAITARRFKNLLIENYEQDPYKGNDSSEL